jgi:hypothetical protein
VFARSHTSLNTRTHLRLSVASGECISVSLLVFLLLTYYSLFQHGRYCQGNYHQSATVLLIRQEKVSPSNTCSSSTMYNLRGIDVYISSIFLPNNMFTMKGRKTNYIGDIYNCQIFSSQLNATNLSFELSCC